MTLSTSLFNLGIFKNTIKRFKWGSFLYFVILFFSVPFVLLVENLERLVQRYATSLNVTPILLTNSFILIPMLLAIAVPTVVAALIFNNVHSSKQSIFVHSLPVYRLKNYVSSILAGLALMAAPVLLNAFILLIMSFTAYGQIISSWSVVYWAGLNLSVLFIMFSVAAFTAFLTGNTAAHIAINVFVHIIPMLVALTVFLISDIFLFGFIQSDNFIASEMMNNTPVVWLFGRAMSHYRNDLNMFAQLQMWIYLIGAGLVYVLGFILYKNRKIETSGDVAAFKVFKPILKYTVTSAAAVAIFSIVTSMNLGAIAVFTVALAATAVVYFAAEMLINKSFKVFKASYKGYLGFTVCCAAFIAFFAYTSVFGYETRIPKSEEIEKAAVFVGWSQENPLIENRQLIEDTRKIHKEFIENISVVEDNDDAEDVRTLRISYKLKNGKMLERCYRVSTEAYNNALTKMYEFEEYKLKVTEIDNLNIENITNLNLGTYTGGFSYYIALNEDAKDLMAAVKKDVEKLSFKEIENGQYMVDLRLEFSCTVKENLTKKIFKKTGYDENSAEAEYAVESFDIRINPNFKNAYEFLKEKGYYDQIVNQTAKGMCICQKPISRAGELYTYKGEAGQFYEFRINPADCLNIEFGDAVKIAELMMNKTFSEVSEGKNYFIFNRSRDVGGNIGFGEKCISFGENELPEYLEKYIEK